jgi:serine/threonine protein kinase
MHANSLVHRDLKPENIVVDHTDTARLCDFGMVERVGVQSFSGSGTPPYMAPEVLTCHLNHVCYPSSPPTSHNQTKFDSEFVHDMWAAGVTFYVMLTGSFPWKQALPTDKNFSAFLRRDYSRGPWSKFSPQLLEVCTVRYIIHSLI